MSDFVRNTWYPLAWTREIGPALNKRRVLGDDLVVYRKSDGSVAALEDTCPHRLAPLSLGKLKGDLLECGYHGLTFDCSGHCVRVPGQKITVARPVVRSYPVAERMGLCWIWMGEPGLADPALIFDLPQYHDRVNWSVAEGDALQIGTHYLELADNLCDPAHVSFVHLSTLGNAASEDVPVQYDKLPGKLVTWRWIVDAPAIPLFQKFGNFSGHVDRWHYYHYYAPSIAVIDFGSVPTGTGGPEGRRDNGIQIYACHFITPVDENTCIDHWLHVKNFQADEATNLALSEQFRIAFNEDKLILEAIHANAKRIADKDGKDARRNRMKLAIDASPATMRRMVRQMIEAERIQGAAERMPA